MSDDPADTPSGRELRQLRHELHRELAGLSGEEREDPAATDREPTAAEVALRAEIERVLADRLDVFEEALQRSADAAGEEELAAKELQAFEGLMRELHRGLQRYFRVVADGQQEWRRREIARIRRLADEQLSDVRDAVVEVVSRCRDERAAALRERCDRLLVITDGIIQQRAEIQSAHRQSREKLKALERLQREASELGESVTQRLDLLASLMEYEEYGSNDGPSTIERALEKKEDCELVPKTSADEPTPGNRRS